VDEMARRGQHNKIRQRRGSGGHVAEFFVKRLHDFASRADDSQIHRDAAFFHCKLFSGGNELFSDSGSLPRRRDAQQADIAAIFFFLDVDAADDRSIFLVNQETSGAHVE